VKKFASEGANVVIFDLNQSQGIPLEHESDGAMGQNLIWSLKGDVSSKSQIDQAFQQIYEKFGRIDILVNNAGICEDLKIMELTEEKWDRMMAINLKSVLFCSQTVYNIMAGQEYGKIINIASTAGRYVGGVGEVHYRVSKAGVIMLTRCLARELAEYQVNVNAIAPITTNTAMGNQHSEAQLAAIIKNIPLGRMAVPKDMANVVAFLASDEAAFITGEVINVDGGRLMD
jgi:NAD(P)-dependent dehydrogenase (short-subunit alcohol dehydrogenase family)